MLVRHLGAAILLITIARVHAGMMVRGAEKDSVLFMEVAGKGVAAASKALPAKALPTWATQSFGFHNYLGTRLGAQAQPKSRQQVASQFAPAWATQQFGHIDAKYLNLVRHKAGASEDTRLQEAEKEDKEKAEDMEEEDEARLKREDDLRREAADDRRRREAELEFKEQDEDVNDDEDAEHVNWAQADRLRGWANEGWRSPKPAGRSIHHPELHGGGHSAARDDASSAKAGSDSAAAGIPGSASSTAGASAASPASTAAAAAVDANLPLLETKSAAVVRSATVHQGGHA